MIRSAKALPTDVEAVIIAVDELAGRDLDAVKALKAKYVTHWPERRLAKELECSRHCYREALKRGREWVARYV